MEGSDDPNAPVKLPSLSCAAWVSENQIRQWPVEAVVQDARVNRCDFVCMPLVKASRALGADASLDDCAEATALAGGTATLTGQLPHMNLVGVLSNWISLDAPDASHRKKSELAFKEQVAFAAHLGLPAVIIPSLGYNTVNLWAAVHQTLLALTNMQIWIWVPLSPPADCTAEGEQRDTYRWWDRFRSACEHMPNLGVVLELTGDIPEEDEVQRWLGEPVRWVPIGTKPRIIAHHAPCRAIEEGKARWSTEGLFCSGPPGRCRSRPRSS